MLKVGLIGASGSIAKTHLKAYELLNQEVELIKPVACCDMYPEKIVVKDNVAIYKDFNELLEKEKGNLDVIDVCVPTFLHKEVTIKALKAGFNVLCEKPMALNYEDAKAMYDASIETGKKLMIAQPLRFMYPFEVIKDYIDNEKLGKFRSIEYSVHAGGLPNGQDGWFKKIELSGGPIFDLHVHDMDLLFWYLGTPESMSAVANCSAPNNYDSISANFAYANGTYANFRSDWKAASGLHEPGRNIRVNFENGYIIFNSKEFVKVEKDAKVTDLSISNEESGFCKEIRYFAQSIINGTPVDMCPPEQSVQVIKAICYEMKSSDLKGERMMF